MDLARDEIGDGDRIAENPALPGSNLVPDSDPSLSRFRSPSDSDRDHFGVTEEPTWTLNKSDTRSDGKWDCSSSDRPPPACGAACGPGGVGERTATGGGHAP